MWSRFDSDGLGADQPGLGAVDAAVAGPGVGFATPTDALGPHPEFAPIRFRKMESARLGFQLGRRRSSCPTLRRRYGFRLVTIFRPNSGYSQGENGLSKGWQDPVNAHRTNALETDRASDMSRPEAAVGSHALRDAWSCKDFGVT